MTDTLEATAQRIAERGRDALLERLRPAFKDAAAKHADVLELSDEQIDEMVQRAANRADGLQWRRALAGVATDELGIGLGEALSHPAVSRAHAIVGAPSYEESLEAVAPRHPTPPAPEPEAEPEAEPEPEPEPDEPEPTPTEPDAEPEPDEPTPAEPDEPTPAEPDEPTPVEPTPTPAPPLAAAAPLEPTPIAASEVASAADDPGDSVRLAVIHLGGVANLAQGERDIELRISHFGLDIVRGSGEALGRLTWSDIETLSVPPAKGLRRRRRESRAHLVIHSDRGDASFEVPALAPDELREHLTPVVERYGHSVQTN